MQETLRGPHARPVLNYILFQVLSFSLDNQPFLRLQHPAFRVPPGIRKVFNSGSRRDTPFWVSFFRSIDGGTFLTLPACRFFPIHTNPSLCLVMYSLFGECLTTSFSATPYHLHSYAIRQLSRYQGQLVRLLK